MISYLTRAKDDPAVLSLLIHVKTVQGRFFYLRNIFTEFDRQQLVAMSYKAFLRTIYWNFIRDYLLEKIPSCTRCGSKERLNVHHRNYEHHGWEHLNLKDLVVLCQECHRNQHVPLRDITDLIEALLGRKIIRHVLKKVHVENPQYDPRTMMNLKDYGDIRGRIRDSL